MSPFAFRSGTSLPFRRVLLVVLDSVGMGGAPDAAAFGDEGADTLGHILASRGVHLPNLGKLGLCRLVALPPVEPNGCWGNMVEQSAGKDTTTGHWEIAGLINRKPFPVYPDGFPRDVMAAFERAVGRGWLWNKPASGTEILEKLGDEHVRTGRLIVYTSGDSVFQIAAHEDVVPLEEQYEICRKARALLKGEHAVSRVIARPFVGKSGSYARTSNRRDFSVEPYGPTLLDRMKDAGLEVAAVGKIEDIFAGRGITRAVHTEDNADGVDQTLQMMKDVPRGLIFTNLVDFDSKFGHRRDVEGYARALEEFDARLPELAGALREHDLLIITADHGNDPSWKGTDHTRERVPLLAYAPGIRPKDLGSRSSFADLGQTVADNFGLRTDHGVSFLPSLA